MSVKNWTNQAEYIIRQYGDKLTDKQLADKLKEIGFITTHWCVAKKRKELGIHKAKGSALHFRKEQTLEKNSNTFYQGEKEGKGEDLTSGADNVE